MALIELAKVVADDPAASRRWAAEPLPPTDRLSAVITSRYAALPEQAQAALLLAAVADGPDLAAAASHGAGPDARALAPAEQLGLVKVDRAGPAVLPSPRPCGHLPLRALCSTGSSTPRARRGPARPARPASLAPGRGGPASGRAGGVAAGGHRCPGAAPRRRGRRGAGDGTRGRTQPRPRGPGAQAGRRRLGRRSHRPGRLGPRSRRPRPGDHDGPGTAADRPPRRRVDAGLVRPAHRRAVSAHLPRRRRIAGPSGPRLGRALQRSHRRLPVRETRQPPGRKPRSGTPGNPEVPPRPAMARSPRPTRTGSGYGPAPTRPAAETSSSPTCARSPIRRLKSRPCGEQLPRRGSWTKPTSRSAGCKTP